MTRRARRALAGPRRVRSRLVGLLASPAGAHSTSGPPASNFHAEVRGVAPAVAGVHARLDADGERIELRVDGRARVTVLGYQGEPYLRVSRAGVFENRASPAVALNRTRVPSGAAPARADRSAPLGPGVRRIHRALARPPRPLDGRRHARAGAARPRPVARDRALADPAPRRRRRGRDRRQHRPRRDHRRRPVGPAAGRRRSGSRWRRCSRSLVLAAATRRGPAGAPRRARGAGGGRIAPPVGELAVLDRATRCGRVGENLPSIAAVAATLLAFGWLARRSVYSAAPLLIIAGLFTAVAGGFADLPVLSHAWIPSRLDPTLARTLVAVALGVGTGVAVVGRAATPGTAAGHLTGWVDAHDLHPHHRRRAPGHVRVARRRLRRVPLDRAAATGHTLVVPRAEVDHWIDLPAATNAHLIGVAHEIGAAQMDAFAPARIGLIIAGLEVPHTHLHVVPIDAERDLSFAQRRSRRHGRSRSRPRRDRLRAALTARGAAGRERLSRIRVSEQPSARRSAGEVRAHRAQVAREGRAVGRRLDRVEHRGADVRVAGQRRRDPRRDEALGEDRREVVAAHEVAQRREPLRVGLLLRVRCRRSRAGASP